MTETERYKLCEKALLLIQEAQLDIDDGPGDRLRDYMDTIWYNMKKEERGELKLPPRHVYDLH